MRQPGDGEGLKLRLLVENKVLYQPSSVSLLPLVPRMVSKPRLCDIFETALLTGG